MNESPVLSTQKGKCQSLSPGTTLLCKLTNLNLCNEVQCNMFQFCKGTDIHTNLLSTCLAALWYFASIASDEPTYYGHDHAET